MRGVTSPDYHNKVFKLPEPLVIIHKDGLSALLRVWITLTIKKLYHQILRSLIPPKGTVLERH